jgi:hypothetical protein
MAIAPRALRALVSIAWQQVFENLWNYFQFILTLVILLQNIPLVKYN